MVILSASNINKSYTLVSHKDVPVLKDVSISIAHSEFVAVVGPSGAGKSTLLHVLATLDKPDSGEVEMYREGQPLKLSALSKKQLAAIRNKYIGFVFQFHYLLPEFTTLENVMFPMLIGGSTMSKASAKARVMLEAVGVQHRAEHKPAELSGGEQQRVAIARALIRRVF
jgi:lipoprotein-releasing system ATP-binding protein